jgi:carnitine-CoA ligase
MSFHGEKEKGDMTEIRGRTVDAVLRERATATPGVEAVQVGEGWKTFGDLDRRADELAAGLSSIGVAPGERVAVISPNREEVVDTILGVARHGAVQVPLNVYLKGEFLRHQLVDSGATTLIADAAGWRSARPLLGQTELRRVVLLDGPEADDDEASGAIEVTTLAAVREAGRGQVYEREAAAADLVSILYTSGTTGMPKGCMLPNGYYTYVPRVWDWAGWVRPGDRFFSAAPLFHAAGVLFQLMTSLVIGSSAHFEESFHASTFMRRATETGATVLMGPGSVAAAVLAQPPSPQDTEHSIREAYFYALHPDRQVEFEQRFGVSVCCESYAQTEIGTAVITPIAEAGERRTMGKPADGYEVRVVDDSDREVGIGEVGELVIRPTEADAMFQGYWRNPEATVATFRNLWHHTGDYVTRDASGRLTFVDRKKDALRRRGENVSALELEQIILQHDGVADVAVCAVPASLGEDDIKVCLVLEEGASIEPASVFDFFRRNLPYFAVPRYVQICDGFPMTATGKVEKHVLRAEGVDVDAIVDFERLGLSVAVEDRRG